MSGILQTLFMAASAAIKDAYFNYVTLLLHGDGTNGAQNNTFLDSSTNNFTITRNGNTTQGTFTPYGSNWSNYFDAASYESISGAVANSGTGDVCVESWVFYTGTYADYNFVFDSRSGGSPFLDGFSIGVEVTSGYFYLAQDVINLLTNIVCQKGVWYHVCATRQSGVFRLFINGVLGGTYTTSNNLSSTSNRIGWYYGSTTSYKWPGYISNFRATNGSVPTTYQTSSTTVGATIFTPSTTVLTTTSQGASNTSLLTCQNNRFIDNSSNAFTITIGGTPSIQRFSPFSPTDAYSPSVIGGSGYFDGSGDYLTVPTNAAFNIGTSSFTLECWFYSLGSTSYQAIVSAWGTTQSDSAFEIATNGTNLFIQIAYGSSQVSFQPSAPPSYQWNHVVMVGNGSTLSAFINGTRVGTQAFSSSINNASYSPAIGYRVAASNYPFLGYVSNPRLVKGTAVYDPTLSTLTVPTAPLTAITNTSLLLNYTNAGIYDNAMMNDLETVGNAQVSTSVVKFGTGSMYFDGTGDWMLAPSSVNFNLSSGNWTIESWYYPTTYSGGNNVLIYLGASSGDKIVLATIGTNGYLYYLLNGTGVISTTSAATLNAWSHYALVKNGATTTLYLNGTSIGTTTSVPTSSAKSLSLGADSGGAAYIGYMDDFRITNGYARYTANFTPPTAAFPNQ